MLADTATNAGNAPIAHSHEVMLFALSRWKRRRVRRRSRRRRRKRQRDRQI